MGVCVFLMRRYPIQCHKFVSICEFTCENPREELLHLALLRGAYVFQVLQHTNKGEHALRAQQRKGSVANFIDSFGVFEGVLFDTPNVRVLAAEAHHNQISDFAGV